MSEKEKKLRHARNLGRLAFVVFGLLAIAGNVLASPDNLVAQFAHALPPVAFIVTVEFAIVFVPEFSEQTARIAYAATGFIALASFVLSFMSLHHVAHDAGMGLGSWLFPVLFEVAALTFSGCALAAGRALAALAEEALLAEQEAAQAARDAAEKRIREQEKEAAREAGRLHHAAAEQVRRETAGPTVAEVDGLTLRERYGDTLPPQREIRDALGWGGEKVTKAVKAYREQGSAPVRPESAPV